MSKNSNASNVSRRRFLAAAGTVAAANSLVAGKALPSDPNTATPPPAPMGYTVTIKLDPDSTTNPFSYCAQDQNGNDVLMPNNSLTVKVGDKVEWTAHTPGSNKHRASVRFATTTPFSRKKFAWSENHKDGDKVQATANKEHSYTVGIYDRDTGEVYSDDPKIIVGGRLDAEIVQAETELHFVQEKIGSVVELLERVRKDLSS